MAVNTLLHLALLAMSPVSMAATLSKRIIGGGEAQSGEFPYLVGIMNRQKEVEVSCGGLLLDSKTVLTAAHCATNDTRVLGPQNLRIRAGSLHLQSGGIESNVSQIVMHPGYNHSTLDSDIAILKLVDPIQEDLPKISYNTRLADEGSDPAPNETVVLAGWGVTSDGSKPQWLKKVEMPVVSREICRESYAKSPSRLPITKNKICAGKHGSTGCEGDSGGPLISKSSGQVVGIVSHGSGPDCNAPGTFGAYTRVANYLSFIRENMECGKTC
ncbi:trypsin-related protease [Ophiocordyceps camponoti-floridani]|uniref:Trypsin-related protease n=1 Tax=Ophiocordyceps camponoti-floridani TaxID=2030778 RepID=A0A8H4Q4C7_9HYPO|nr:trypsin-related protease [Ophiocordyceps camponoti-floridani]